MPGLLVLGAFLTLGLALWFLVLRPAGEPARLPLAPKPPEAKAGASSLPASHPPIEIPAEVKGFLVELEQKTRQNPKDIEAWKNAAQVQYRAGQIDRQYLSKAEASWRHVLSLDPKDLDALRGLGNVHFDRDEYGEAVAQYARYLEIRPDDPNVRTDLGTMYLYDGKDDDAIREYRKVVEQDPKFYQAHFNLGIAYAKKGDTAKAIEVFETAKSLAPDDKTRAQIQTMIDRTSGREVPASASAPPPGFQRRIEQSLRSHPIAGSKVVRFEWSSETEGKVLLDEFPMEAMPEFARSRFLDRLKNDLAEAKRATGTAGPARLELVDRASGKAMATVTAE